MRPCQAALFLVAACGPSAPSAAGTTSTGEATSSSSTTSSTTSGVDSSTTEASTSTSESSSSSTSESSSSSTGADSGLPAIGPTSGTFTFDPTVGIAGNGSLHVGEIAITDAFGTVEIDDVALPVLVYEEQPFGEWTLYQSLAVAPDGWTVIWFYCQEGMLTDVYFETTTGLPLQYELASGTCDIVPGATQTEVEFPGTEFALVYNGEDFSIDGAEIAVTGGQLGTIRIEGIDFVLAPFETVDCADCGGAGWFEVHAILWDPEAVRACFAIFYLLPDADDVQMTYAMCLPDLVDPMGSIYLPATWTIG